MRFSASIGLADFFHEAQALFQKRLHAKIEESVVNIDPIATGRDNAEVGQSLQLIGERLRFHPDRRRQIGNANFVRSNQGMQKPQTGVVGEHFEDRSQTARLDRRQERSVLQGLGRAASGFVFPQPFTYLRRWSLFHLPFAPRTRAIERLPPSRPHLLHYSV